MDQLTIFGWTGAFDRKWKDMQLEGLQPARVVADFGTSLKVAMPDMHTAELTGKLAHHSNRDNVPKVGDWVAVRLSDSGHAVIEAIVPRQSEIARKVAGNRTLKQVIAANVDVAFVLLALDDDFSIKRLQRFLYQLSIGNISPVIVLNKADKTDNVRLYTEQLQMLNLPVIIAAVTTGRGVDEILACILPGKTAILLGSSGVGKSTLTNRLLGRETQGTQAIRESDSTGRHTTVHRELFMLPGGGLLIDTPGIRELQLWGTQDDLDESFDDVATLVSQCKYSTCRHGNEEGCAIRSALQSGVLDKAHYENYVKMKHELAGLKQKNLVQQQRKNKRPLKSVRRQARDTMRDVREQMS